VDDGGTVFLVVLGGNPAGGEGAEGSESGGTLPDGVLTVGGGNEADLGTWGEEGLDLVLETVSKTFVHGGTTGEDDVLAKLLADIDLGSVDGGMAKLGEGLAGLAVKVGLEEELGGLHADGGGDGDNTLVGKGVGLVLLGGVLGISELLLVVEGNVSLLLLDVTDDFELGSGGEGLTGSEEELLHPVGKDTAGNFHLLDGVGNAVTFVDGDGVGHTITSVTNETGGTASGVKGHNSLEGDIAVLNLEVFEHDSDHLLSVTLGVTGGLGKEDTGGLLGGDTELVVEGVGPDLLHILPGINDTSSDGVVQVQDTSLLLSLFADVLGLVVTALDSGGVLWATNDRGENSTGCFLTSETGFDHTGSIVNNYCLCFFCHRNCS